MFRTTLSLVVALTAAAGTAAAAAASPSPTLTPLPCIQHRVTVAGHYQEVTVCPPSGVQDGWAEIGTSSSGPGDVERVSRDTSCDSHRLRAADIDGEDR